MEAVMAALIAVDQKVERLRTRVSLLEAGQAQQHRSEL
jgi:hypothetical protein